MNDQHDSRPHPGTDRPACRRCRRPLQAPAAVAAGIGAHCALQAAAETTQGAPAQPHAPQAPAAALALVTARLAGLPTPVVDGILDDAPAAELAVILADLTSWMLTHTAGGEAWLRRVGLTWAREAEA